MRKGTTKSQGQKHVADKFYTKPEVAQICLDAIPGGVGSYDVAIEPSAGSGSFSSLVSGSLAFDLHPEGTGIIEQDWFAYERVRASRERVLVFGNPPFGQQNSISVKFINHAAGFADTVAFILPRSFKKPSVQNRLDKHLHLVFEMDVPKNAFTLEGQDYDVPCVFQVWEYDETKTRAKEAVELPAGFSFVKKDQEPHFSVQRVGGRSGFADLDWTSKSVQSNYFIKLDGTPDDTLLAKTVVSINASSFPSRDHSVGPRSISKGDVTKVLNAILK